MEMVGGITVSPLEVEAVLRTHPAVREVAVASVTDERGATALRAYVVIGVAARSGPTSRPPGPAWRTNSSGWPASTSPPSRLRRTVSLVPSLPRTPTGKLRRHLVRQGAW